MGTKLLLLLRYCCCCGSRCADGTSARIWWIESMKDRVWLVVRSGNCGSIRERICIIGDPGRHLTKVSGLRARVSGVDHPRESASYKVLWDPLTKLVFVLWAPMVEETIENTIDALLPNVEEILSLASQVSVTAESPEAWYEKLRSPSA